MLVTDGDGTLFPRARPYSPLVDGLIEALNADGVTVVELAWRPGLWGGPRARSRACGFSTALRWIRDTVHETGPALFAAEGRGEGASQIAFALAHYGAGDYLDLAVLAAGPVLCPLCDAGGDGPAEPLLPHGVDSRAPLLEDARTSVRFLIGDSEPSSAVRSEAQSYGGQLVTELVERVAAAYRWDSLDQPLAR